jgi:eukaryotic-like serine/threonine-protein kinase
MADEKWQKVREIFDSALRQKPADRRRFVHEVCGDDKALLAEVESLLSSIDSAESFMETPAVAKVAHMIEVKTKKLEAGKCFGHYEIINQIGEGGMGEVYLAKDTRLERKTAIKVLRGNVAQDEERMRRFVREAKSASALNHPNIITIYEIGEIDNTHFIATEHIEGDTLRERLKGASINLKSALDVAIQVANALDAAHRTGIVHRDVKPENVMIRPDGLVKILDFGIAKLSEPPVVADGLSVNDSEAATAIKPYTSPGMIIGTVAYMSPEQARGLAVDARTDVWSLGVVLYEMAAGRLPFEGQTSSDVISSILQKEPPAFMLFSDEADARLDEIVTKALTKDKEERYQSAKDLFIDLKRLKHHLDVQAEIERTNPAELSNMQGGARSSGISHSISPPVFLGVEITANQTANQTIIADKRITIDSNLARSGSKRIVAIVTAAVLLASIAVWVVWHRRNLSWARNQVPQIETLSSNGNYFAAYDLATETQKYLPNDSTIIRLMPTISDTLTVTSEPSGAQVYLKRFSPDVAGNFPPRQVVGTTPINNLRVARGQYILYIEKDGYAKTERTVSGAIMHAGSLIVLPPPIRVEEKLIATDKMPDRMVFVPGADYRLVAWARPTDARVRLNDYFIDKYEVSNQDYKEFINAGGYLKKQFWKYAFIKDNKTLSWEEAMKEFKDRAGLAGPRSWSGQNFPEGKADYPVTDITWYEAAAFAAFKGKQLPTIFQWEKAARNGKRLNLVNYMPWGVFDPGGTLDYHANFNNNGTMPVNSLEFGMSPFGVYNMAGNVSEWSLNETSEGFVADGGAWGEPSYMFANYAAFPGFYSSNKVGFRCALNFADATGDQGAMRIDSKKEIPVYTPSSDASFNNWLSYYRYNKTPLDPQIVEVKETNEWRREKITFNGADGERAIAYLYLPKNFPRPLQVIHLSPATDVENGLLPLPDAIEDLLAPFIKSGRAVFGVVLRGYIERLRPEGYAEPEPTTVEYREKIVNWITDLRRGLDYLETRNDIDARRIAFYGPSAGARIGLILAAVENRYASVVMRGAGLWKSYVPWIAEANPINFASHIRATKLMVHGRYDETLSLRTDAEPLYKLMPEPKRLVLYDGGHVAPFEFMVTTMNGWLDETLGPVKRE